MNYFNNGEIFTGINYWASHSAINMWTDWDENIVYEDLKKLSEDGITALRVFPLWPVFQPINAIRHNFGVAEYRMGEDPFPDTEAGKSGVSEDACLKFQKLCDIANEFGIKLIVGLITGHMSGRYYCPPALMGKNLVSDPTAVKWELRFVKYFVSRFKDDNAILGWDLGNECCGFPAEPDVAYVWCSAICNTIRNCDDKHPVISGFDHVGIAGSAFNIQELSENVDVNTVHPYSIFAYDKEPLVSVRSILDGIFKCRLYSDLSGKQTFIQEVGSIGYLNCSENTEADFYRALLYSSLANDCLGVMWWCAFDQGHMQYAPYDNNNIGSNYGFYRKDGSKKKLAEENVRFKENIKSLPFDKLPPCVRNAVCIIPKTTGEELVPMLNTTYCLAKQAGLELSFSYAGNSIPESDLYIMPSVTWLGISRTRLYEMLEYVKNGASLYISLGNAMMRDVPELTGVTFAYKESCDSPEQLTINGKTISIKSVYKYYPEQCNAEVLAVSEDSRPVFTRNKYGNGYIYFSTVSVEEYINSLNNPFEKDGAENYREWYKLLPRKNRLKLVSSNHLVLTTEHIIGDNERIVIAINYSHLQQQTEFSLADGWSISDVYIGDVKNNICTLASGDAAIIKIKK